jgi:hypothetical protein
LSEQLIVAGFHRSGTSLISQLLKRAGLFLGYELFRASFANPHGYIEDVEVLKLHRRILADNGQTWQITDPFLPVVTERHWQEMRRIIGRRNADHELWGFKDPRVCLFLMMWKHLLPNAKVLLVYRRFSDSTRSLGQRHSTLVFLNRGDQRLHKRFWEEPDLGLRMWLAHNEALLRFARSYPEDTLAVSWDMVQNSFPVVEAINKRWNLGLDEVPASEVFDPAVAGGRSAKQPVSDRRLIDRTEATWQALEEMSEQTRQMMEEARV